MFVSKCINAIQAISKRSVFLHKLLTMVSVLSNWVLSYRSNIPNLLNNRNILYIHWYKIRFPCVYCQKKPVTQAIRKRSLFLRKKLQLQRYYSSSQNITVMYFCSQDEKRQIFSTNGWLNFVSIQFSFFSPSTIRCVTLALCCQDVNIS